jgi:hypothetical protein
MNIAVGWTLATGAAHGGEETRAPVALELILAVDTSASVDAREFELQIRGIAEAFAHPEVIAAIESLGSAGLAVTLVQWSVPGNSAMVLPFHQVHDARTAKAFGFLVGLAQRRGFSGSTAMGHAIDYCIYLLENNEFAGERRVIDVSGDGRNNAPPDVEPARDAAVRRGITINGLAILSDDPRLDIYYKRSVIGGPDAFVEVADDFSRFAAAIRQKLIREIYPPLS